jgi:purine nucleosidase
MRRPIIIDTDPGQDDAVALLLALASPAELEVLGIVAVAGNVPLALTQRNARIVCELAGRPDLPVYAGCARPMQRDLVTAEYIHGKTGLDGPVLPEPTMPLQPQHGVDYLVDTLRRAAPAGTTLCTLGPLTNIGMALVKAPDIVPKVREIVMMGGAYFEVGNTTPAAEFNVYVDPQAADLVLRSGIPVTIIPLDVSHKALTTKPRIARFRALGTRCGRAVAEMLEFFERHDVEKYGADGGPLHDPGVIAYLLRPELYRGRKANVAIETIGALTLGMTVVDWWRVTDRPPNAQFMNDVDADGFYDLLTERIGTLP